MNISTSLICMPMDKVGETVDRILKAAGDDERFRWFHGDFMDAHFVARLGISPELIQFLRRTYGDTIKIDSHLMIEDPYTYVDVIAPYSDWVTIHYEAVTDPVRTLQKIRKTWPDVKVGIAYNLMTHYDPFVADLFDGVMFMGISPGVLGTNSYPELVMPKIANVPSDKMYFVDGSVNFETIKLYNSINPNGTLVCGSSTMFKQNPLVAPNQLIESNIEKIKDALKV